MCDRLAIKAIIRRKHQIDLQMSNVIGDNLKCQPVLAKAFTTIRNRAGELGRQSHDQSPLGQNERLDARRVLSSFFQA